MKETDIYPQFRYFLELSYRGEAFHGWQRQPNALSVQQRVEEALSIVLRKDVSVTGAGRTDTGVNARTMVAHFDTDSPIADRDRLLRSLSRLSGRDIAYKSLRRVCKDAHARFDAQQREYRYFVAESYSPFSGKLMWTPSSPIDFDKMNEAAKVLLSTSDFTSFAKLHSDAKTNICDVRKAEWTPVTGEFSTSVMQFTICADRFLRNMVRAVVGTLIEVGRHKMTVEDFKRVIDAKDRCAAGVSMPSEPLFLWDIKYPSDIFLD